MALTRIDNPTPSAPAALADYVQILAVQMNAILQALRNNSHACIDFTANVARAGVVFYVAGVLYKAVTEQAIGGTPSKYVKIDPSGATASIDYVASLTGVTWSDEQSGYYDGSGNLYVFDEARAVYDGVVASGKTAAGQLAFVPGALSVKGALTVLGASNLASISNAPVITSGLSENGTTLRRKLVAIGDWNMDSTAFVVVAHGLTGQNIRRVTAFIRNDSGATAIWYPIDYEDINGGGTTTSGSILFGNTNIQLDRRTSGFFDDTNFNSTSYNRGYIIIDYEA
jgi:hypothetical protein